MTAPTTQQRVNGEAHSGWSPALKGRTVTAAEIAQALGGRSTGKNSWMCHCPCVGHADHNASLAVSVGKSVEVVLFCHFVSIDLPCGSAQLVC